MSKHLLHLSRAERFRSENATAAFKKQIPMTRRTHALKTNKLIFKKSNRIKGFKTREPGLGGLVSADTIGYRRHRGPRQAVVAKAEYRLTV